MFAAVAERRVPIHGEIDYAVAGYLGETLSALIDAIDDDVVLECAAVTFIDSAGIAVFVKAQRLLQARGRVLRVENLNDRCRRTFEIVGLDEVLGIRDLDPA